MNHLYIYIYVGMAAVGVLWLFGFEGLGWDGMG